MDVDAVAPSICSSCSSVLSSSSSIEVRAPLFSKVTGLRSESEVSMHDRKICERLSPYTSSWACCLRFLRWCLTPCAIKQSMMVMNSKEPIAPPAM